MAVSVSVLKSLANKIGGEEFNKIAFWKHSIAAGEAGRIIAIETNYENPARAYIIGLLHDIGKVALSFINKSEFDEAVFEARALSSELYKCEDKIFGFNHQDAGNWLCTRWQLPELIIAGIKYHHSIEACPAAFQQEALLAHISNFLVKDNGIGNSGGDIIPSINDLAESKLKLTPKKLNNAKKSLLDKRNEIDNFLELLL